MSYNKLIEVKESKLLRIIRPHTRLVTCLASKSTLFDDRIAAAIRSRTDNYDRNSLLLSWLKKNDERPDALAAFLAALRDTNQAHVANFITGEPEDLPLPDDMVDRLTKIKGNLADNTEIENSSILEVLRATGTLSEYDCDLIKRKFTTYDKCEELLDIISRGSERSLQNLAKALIDSGQPHIASYLREGGVLRIHLDIEITEPDTEVEDLDSKVAELITKWNNIKALKDRISNEEWNRLNEQLRRNGIQILKAETTNSIEISVYIRTLAALASIQDAYVTKLEELNGLFQDILRCLTHSSAYITVTSIGEEEFHSCADQIKTMTSFNYKTANALCLISASCAYAICCFNKVVW